MYRCQHCKKVVPPNTPSNFVAVEYRPKTYQMSIRQKKSKSKRSGGWSGDHMASVGSGYEIVREILVCPACASQLKDVEKQAAESATA